MTDHEIELSLTRGCFGTSPELDVRIRASALSRLRADAPRVVRSPALLRKVHGRRGLLAVAAAVLLVAAMSAVWLSRPTEGWAQVQASLRDKPWILAAYTEADGTRHEDWTSSSRDVSAMRHGDFVRFDDHRLRVIYEYNAKEKTLTRSLEPEVGGKRRNDNGFDGLMQQMFRGKEQLESDAPEKDVEIVEQKRQPVTKHDRAWQSYELVVRSTDRKAAGAEPSVRLTFLVDPQTRLPAYVLMSVVGKEPLLDAPPPAEFTITYPEKGPIDIYDLGVPRDATLVDLVPKDDMRQLIAAIKASAERFEPHRALNVMSSPEAVWYAGTPFVVWRKGTSRRMVFGLVDAAAAPPALPAPDADRKQWWKRRWTELFHHPIEICDGTTFWNNQEAPPGWYEQADKPHPLTWKRSAWPAPVWKSRREQDPWPAGSSPLFAAYPRNLVNYAVLRMGPPQIELEPADGPANTIKITVPTGSSEAPTQSRYWIDPQRSHMTVRHEMVNRDMKSTPSVDEVFHTETVEEADKSPGGIWYPTLIRHLSVSMQEGRKTTLETVTRHYLDFDVKFSNDLFQPVARPGEPLE